jgi:hypothetical protein
MKNTTLPPKPSRPSIEQLIYLAGITVSAVFLILIVVAHIFF